MNSNTNHINRLIFPVRFKKLYDDVELPIYATEGSAGFDVAVHNFKEYYDSSLNPELNPRKVSEVTEVLMTPHSRLLIGAGYALEIPANTQLEIRSRGGMSLKKGLIILNSPGTVDEDFRGEIAGILCNTSEFAIVVKKGDRVGQAVLLPYFVCAFEIVDELSDSDRGHGAFGHTGENVDQLKKRSENGGKY